MKEEMGKNTTVTLTLLRNQFNSGKNRRIIRRIQKPAFWIEINTNFNSLKSRCQIHDTHPGFSCSKLNHNPSDKIIPFHVDNYLKNGRSQGVYLPPLIKDYLKLTFRWLNLDKTKLKGTSPYLLKCYSNLELKTGRDLKGSKLHAYKHIGTKIKITKKWACYSVG